MGKAVALILFSLPLFSEGMGIKFIHQYILYFYLLLPFLLYLYSVASNNRLVLPLKACTAFIIFLLFSFISVYFSAFDKQIAFENVLFSAASFFIFVFFYNNKKLGENIVIYLSIVGGILFTVYFLLISYFEKIPYIFSPYHGYQLVFSHSSSHNHLGDFLGVVMLLSLDYILLKNRLIYILPFIASLPFFLFSYSRSAYVAFLLGASVWLACMKNALSKTKLKIMLIVFAVLSCIIASYFFLTVKEAKDSPVFKPVYTLLTNTFSLKPKDLFAQRPEYFYQALKSFYAHPLWGVGAGNFIYASRQYASVSYNQTETAHNIFLEILVENGIFALLAFSVFIILLLIHGFKKPSIYFFLFLYLLLNFQTDYTYRIYSVFILFMILAGIFYEEKKEINLTFLYGAGSLGLFVILELMLASVILLKSDYARLAYLAYPLNKNVYPALINAEKAGGNNTEAIRLMRQYEQVAPRDIQVLSFLAGFYESYDKYESIRLYEKLLQSASQPDSSIKQKIEDLKKKQ